MDKRLEDIVARAISNDKRAFDELCRLKGQSIIYLCIKYMGNQYDGEDAAQEVLIKMQRSISTLSNPSAFNVWLYSIVRSTCANIRRKNMKLVNSLSASDPYEEFKSIPEYDLDMLPESYIETQEKQRYIAQIIDNLPQGMRTTILLYYFEHLSYKEIAEIQDVSVMAVRNSLQRAKAKIRQEIESQKTDVMGEKTVSFSALALIFQSEMDEAVPPKVVEKCIRAAGVGKPLAVQLSKPIAIGAGLAISAGVAIALLLPLVFASGPRDQENVPQHFPASQAAPEAENSMSIFPQSASWPVQSSSQADEPAQAEQASSTGGYTPQDASSSGGASSSASPSAKWGCRNKIRENRDAAAPLLYALQRKKR